MHSWRFHRIITQTTEFLFELLLILHFFNTLFTFLLHIFPLRRCMFFFLFYTLISDLPPSYCPHHYLPAPSLLVRAQILIHFVFLHLVIYLQNATTRKRENRGGDSRIFANSNEKIFFFSFSVARHRLGLSACSTLVCYVFSSRS